MKDKKLRRYLGVKEDYSTHSTVIENIQARLDKIFVKDYFKSCPCCSGTDEIFKPEAISFEKLIHDWPGSYTHTYWTTQKSYDLHKKAIDEWKEEIIKFNRKNGIKS